MYENLKQGLQKKGMTNSDLAKLLDVSVKTVSNKLNGATPFILPEVNKIMVFIFPEYSMTYIFKEFNNKNVV